MVLMPPLSLSLTLSLSLSRLLSLSSISLGRSTIHYPVSAQSLWMEVLIDRSTLVYLFMGTLRRISLQFDHDFTSTAQYVMFALFERFVKMDVKWLFICFLVRCCFQDFSLNIMQHPCAIFIEIFSTITSLNTWWCIHSTILTWLQLGRNQVLFLSETSDFHKIENILIAAHTFYMRLLTSFSVDEILLPKKVKWSTNVRGLPFNLTLGQFCLKCINHNVFDESMDSYNLRSWDRWLQKTFLFFIRTFSTSGRLVGWLGFMVYQPL